MVINLLLDGLAYGMILFVISVGLSVTLGLMGFVNLAHGAFATLGGYAVVAATGAGLGFIPALLLAAVAVGLAAIPVERFVYRPLYRASDLAQVLMTIGLVLVVTALVTIVFGPASQTVTLPPSLSGQVDLLGTTLSAYRFFVIVVGLAIAAALVLTFDRTTVGARIRAAVDNRAMAEASGINVDRLFRRTFALGCGLAALGGGLAIGVVGLNPRFALQYLVYFLIVTAVGGLGNLRGAFVAALLLGVVDNAGKYFMPATGAFVLYGTAVLLLLARPRGLFGRPA
jgi:branched-chain amino acid transport system permease protein